MNRKINGKRNGRPAKRNIYIYMLPVFILAAFAFLYLIRGALAGAGKPGGVSGNDADGRGGAGICFFDVGQGDSIFLWSGEASVLIDTGEQKYGGMLIDELRRRGVSRIDVLIGTHPHGDHIGGMHDIIGAFSIGKLYFPHVYNNTKQFEQALTAVARKGLRINAPADGETLTLPGGMELSFLGPAFEDGANINNSSIVIKAVFTGVEALTLETGAGGRDTVPPGGDSGGGTFTVLLTADTEHDAEAYLLECGADLSADVLKVGHHGSATSTGAEFLEAVNPSYAVIQCGGDNPYGHPDAGVVDLLASRNATILRTDVDGTVSFYVKRVK